MAAFVSKSKKDGLNALNTPFDVPGAGLVQAGVTDKNLHAKFDKLRDHRAEKEGGSAQLWKDLSRWTTTKNAAGLGPSQARLFNKYLATGEKPAGLSDATVKAALDWGIREQDRFQNHKENFFDTGLGQLLHSVGTIAAGFIPVVGPFVAAGLGAMNSAIRTRQSGTDMIFATVKGGLAGMAGSNISKGLSAGGSLFAPANGAGITATGGGGFAGVTNFGINLLTSPAAGAIGKTVAGLAVDAVTGGAFTGPPAPRDRSTPAVVAAGVAASSPRTPLPDPDKEAASDAGKARIAASRLGRTNSWIIDQRGGRGDPRRLPNRRPVARSGSVIPIADYTPTGRPVATTTVRNGQTTIQMVA